LICSLLPNLELTKFSKIQNKDRRLDDLTKNSKNSKYVHNQGESKKDTEVSKGFRNQDRPSPSSEEENNEQLYIKSRKKLNNCNTRAGGLAWLRYRLDMAGVVGSNPTRPIRKLSHFE
jgi:hypothetical protein